MEPNRGPILPPATLGVLGGGQLGRMFVLAAHRMGYRAAVLAGDPDEPGAQVANEVILGRVDDPEALDRLAAACAAVTVEFENVSAEGMKRLAEKVPVRPGWRSVWISQDRLREKGFLAENGFATAPWRPVLANEDLGHAIEAVGLPLILKTAQSGYDGKGQVRVDSPGRLREAWDLLGRSPCVAEGVVSFTAELSVITARGADGEVRAYPPCLNSHHRHILDTTVCPAPVGPVVTQQAREVSAAIATAIGHVGVLTVEFFLSADGDLRVNELAPRPHNSGHLTIEAAPCSQFEQQVRALCGLPLGPAELASPAAMANILGDLWRGGEPRWDRLLAEEPGTAIHLYGKRRAAPGRKMGHLTALDPLPERALDRVLAARGAL
jgi:5-(carboxyamino)imidazole ribonucleotide synthase